MWQPKTKYFYLPFLLQVASINAMRNIVSRSKNLIENFVKLSVEELLNQTAAMHQAASQTGVGDAVKAALRDMGLKVHLKEEWTGDAVTITSS